MKEINFLNCRMHSASMKQTIDFIDDRISSGIFTQHVVVNVAKLIHMQKDLQLKNSVEACDIINIDGAGVVLGARFLGYDIQERVAGVDLFHELLHLSEDKNYPIFLLGATEDVVQKTAQKIKEKHSDIKLAGYHHGYFWDDEVSVVKKIKDSGAKLLFVAITSPKKENFINKWKADLGVDFVMGVGGTFDVVAGKVSRAPLWMQKYGLEWFYRILQEPRRMWKRYLTTNSKFAWYLIKAKFCNR